MVVTSYSQRSRTGYYSGRMHNSYDMVIDSSFVYITGMFDTPFLIDKDTNTQIIPDHPYPDGDNSMYVAKFEKLDGGFVWKYNTRGWTAFGKSVSYYNGAIFVGVSSICLIYFSPIKINFIV